MNGYLVPGLAVAIEASNADSSASLFTRYFGMTVGVGLIEESVKLFPVFWMASRTKGKSVSITSIVYLGVISGLAFGATEAIMYSFLYAESLQKNEMAAASYITIQILRFISLPFLHAVWCGISSYFVGLAIISRTGSRILIAVGLTTAALSSWQLQYL